MIFILYFFQTWILLSVLCGRDLTQFTMITALLSRKEAAGNFVELRLVATDFLCSQKGSNIADQKTPQIQECPNSPTRPFQLSCLLF